MRIVRKNYKNLNKKIDPKKIGILIASIVVVLAIIIGGIYQYIARKSQIAETFVEALQPQATLPQVSFTIDNKEVNILTPYRKPMDITTMRDTVTPLNARGEVQLNLIPNNNKIEKVIYEVHGIDGENKFADGEVTNWEGNTVILPIGKSLSSLNEYVLTVTLEMENEKQVSFYTRLITDGAYGINSKLSFVEGFHNATLTKNKPFVKTYLGLSKDQFNQNLSHVTVNASESQVTWNNLEPVVRGSVQWNILECTEVFTMVKLQYQIELPVEIEKKELLSVEETTEENKKSTSKSTKMYVYNVEEFYRVIYNQGKGREGLTQYERRVEQVLDVKPGLVGESGIELGLSSGDVHYRENKEKTNLAFVKERELWNYSIKENRMVRVFGMADSQDTNPQHQNKNHNIRILDITSDGSISFLVYGYMNRGAYEGLVGTAAYYYDGPQNVVMEIGFVEGRASYNYASEDLKQDVYYSHTQNKLYVVAMGSFYEIDLKHDKEVKLSNQMEPGAYVFSQALDKIAYQSVNEEGNVQVTTLDLESGTYYNIATAPQEEIVLLGYIGDDFMYGYKKKSDIYSNDKLGEKISPMYKVEIRDVEGKIVKAFQQEDTRISEVEIEQNMATLTMVKLQDNIYHPHQQEVITGNKQTDTRKAQVKAFTSGELKRIYRLVLVEQLLPNSTIYGTSKYVNNKDALYISYEMQEQEVEENKYYVFAKGGLLDSFTKVSDAISLASSEQGAVVDQNQYYVWRSGSRSLNYNHEKESLLVQMLQAGNSAVEIVQETGKSKHLYYTGCTTEQMCYLLNQGQVIAARLKNQEWILLVGYQGDNMYYRDAQGNRRVQNMNKLDQEVEILVGDGMYY